MQAALIPVIYPVREPGRIARADGYASPGVRQELREWAMRGLEPRHPACSRRRPNQPGP